MPPRKMTQAAIEQLIAERVAATLAEHEANRAKIARGSEATGPAGGVAGRNTTLEIHSCTYKNFLNCNPHTFSGTEGVGRLLTWWNAYVQSVGIDVAYLTPWAKLKKMVTAEYCPRNELQKLEVEFWNLTVKGDDITGYTKRFNELALLCPIMVEPKYKKTKWFAPKLEEAMIATRKSGRTTKEETTTTTITATTTIITNKTDDKKPSKLMPVPQLKEGIMLGTNRCATDASCITQAHALLGAEVVKRGHYKNECPKKKGQQVDGWCSWESICDEKWRTPTGPEHGYNFNVVIGMDWLSEHHAVIVCDDKIYLEKGCQVFLAHVTEKKLAEKRLEDVPIVRDFSEVFPKALPRIMPTGQAEVHIDMVPGATPVVRALYRLAP
ncbi:putative reverse transcriptase domain-containing protein [Tanacetum coccineum]